VELEREFWEDWPVNQWTDTHAHLDFPEFAPDVDGVVERALAAGVRRIISIGCDLESSRRAIALAERYPGVWATVGWHPNHVDESAPDDVRPGLRELVGHPKVVAIGECGVDLYRLPSARPGGTEEDDLRMLERQRRAFQQQLELAAEVGLNVVVHQRAAHREAMEIFRPYADRVRGVFHCFVGTLSELEEVLGLGSYVSFTGIVTFKNGELVRAAMGATPSDRFFLETDSPFLAPVPYRGKTCEPAYVREIAERVAMERGITPLELSTATEAAVEGFFPRMKVG
jgi:TatD DNase family protein